MRPGKLSRLIEAPKTPALLRGEIWVSPAVLAESGFEQGPRGLVEFARSMGADITFFHWPESILSSDLKEMLEFAHGAGLDCGLTVDGPFQRLTVKRNVLELLQELGRDPSNFRALLEKETEEIGEILNWVKESDIDLIVITEDLGYTGGLYFSPKTFQELLLPIYKVWAGQLSSTRIALGWHSDGSVEPLLPDLIDSGFRFFSLEPECVDLVSFKHRYGPRAILISGIRSDWLMQMGSNPEQRTACLQEIRALAGEGGFVLASSSGIYNPKFLPSLRQVYRLADEVKESMGLRVTIKSGNNTA